MANVNEQTRNAERESKGNAKGGAIGSEQSRTTSYVPATGTTAILISQILLGFTDLRANSRAQDAVQLRPTARQWTWIGIDGCFISMTNSSGGHAKQAAKKGES